ncbi:MAG: hypothetical protein RDV48_21375 [Candidatus Eremiobacteraeota bacterium]|nr:hypothetical protein [Candidatus Eremiobacteraeota bacterium]
MMLSREPAAPLEMKIVYDNEVPCHCTKYKELLFSTLGDKAMAGGAGFQLGL